ncbi:diaminopimelate decarboxylase [Spirochaetia bacterium]|nr:diaminopimelate decarboxylase [Spirochaetia bacterium]
MHDRISLKAEQARSLVAAFGSPLYVYDEAILRQRCRDIKALCTAPGFSVNYSAKANSNIELLKIVKSEGLHVDAMSPGEILAELAAGFAPDEILFICNNVSAEEMRFAVERGIMVSVDSLSQLETFGREMCGRSAPHGDGQKDRRIAFRLNPGIGAGHNAKVVTGGKSKFGIEQKAIPQVKEIAARYGLTIAGIDQHIGSLFLRGDEYLAAAQTLFETAAGFPDLEFVDLGGGFGVPYRNHPLADSAETSPSGSEMVGAKMASGTEPRLDLCALSAKLTEAVGLFTSRRPARPIRVIVEPGRYIVAECGITLGTVHSIKENYGETYVGTDIGFNVLMRPVLYDSWHDICFFAGGEGKGGSIAGSYSGGIRTANVRPLTVTGNICESGDILARDRELPLPEPGDIIGVENTGAYGYVMASAYNMRGRPAEVLIGADGAPRLIRKRETWEDLIGQT